MLSIWDNKQQVSVDWDTYNELKSQTLVSLLIPYSSFLDISAEIKKDLTQYALQQISYNMKYKYEQSKLNISVPYTILKGTAVAQYYPYPEYRTMGDIDVMTYREDYICACNELIENKWKEITNANDLKRGRHRAFAKEGIVVEIHAFFASMNDPEKAETLDDLIVENITDNHILPDMINGLVLIDHINQHMEEGIGLRQIIDWMMFVHKCLPDDKWPEFESIAQKTGLETLAITTTRMCEMYLGLPSHKWCAKANERLCQKLMDYVMKCGNFGMKKDQEEAIAVSRTGRLRHPHRVICELQKRGVKNWKFAQNPLLMPFAWLWQGIQFIKDTPRFIQGYFISKDCHSMFKKLGVKREENGLVYYVDGKYIKKEHDS